MDENTFYQEKQPKLLFAILTAIGMGLVGCLLWGLLYYVGYIAWAAAFVVIYGSAWAYKKFNLKLDVKGYIIIFTIAVVEVVLTMLLTLNISCMIELSKEGISVSFFECFKLMFEVIGADASLKSAVILDAVLSLVFLGVGMLSFFYIEKRKNSKSQKTEAKQNETEEFENNTDEKTQKIMK